MADAQIEQTFSGFSTVFEAILAAQDFAILRQTVDFKVRASGNRGTMPVTELFRFRDGKVIEWRAIYLDVCLVAKAINGS